MRKLEPLQLRAWTLPFLVAALVVPPIAGFAIGGPGLGLAVGFAVVATLVVLAARARFDEPIEVGRSPAGRFLLLVVALVAIEDPSVAVSLGEIARAGAKATGSGEGLDMLVLAPAAGSAVAEWLSDVGPARLDAQRRLALSIATLAAAGLEARGRVGDADPAQAVEDCLRTFPAQEVVFVTPPGSEDGAVADVRRRLDRPVRALAASRPGAGQAASSSRRP